MLNERQTFTELMKEVDLELAEVGEVKEEKQDSSFNQNFNLTDAIDSEMLMHRDSHFGGSFSAMIDYYESEGKGVNFDFDLERIRDLAQIEEERGGNLAADMLSAKEAEKVAKAKEAYRKLKEVYTVSAATKSPACLLADLILSESEDSIKEIKAITQREDEVLPLLLELLSNDIFNDPLFPGYGKAPSLAAECLGEIANPQAVVPLFELLGKSNDDLELAAIGALKKIGEKAKIFLTQTLKGKPVTNDNRNAGAALALAFSGDCQVADACFEVLQQVEEDEDMIYVGFLILSCVGLTQGRHEEFANWSKKAPLAQKMEEEVSAVFADWAEAKVAN